jgi:signal transduction histidine kinase
MNLTQQFLIVLILPLSFVGMAIYSGWKGVYRPRIRLYWLFSLLVAALWASSLLGVYVGMTIPVAIPFTWQTLGRHALSLLSLLLLLTTTVYLMVPAAQYRLTLAVSSLLWIAALALDPAIWAYDLGQYTITGQQVSHFDLWAAVWVAAWFVPLLATWLLTRHAYLNAPGVNYRNQLAYWLLMLVLFGLGGGFALVQQPGQPFWQELGCLIQIVAALLGTTLMTRSQLPDFRLASRQLTGRLAGAVIIFGFSLLALLLLTELIPARAAGNTTLYLIISATAFVLLFMLLNRLAHRLVNRWLPPPLPYGQLTFFTRPDIQERLDQPVVLAEVTLTHVQETLTTKNGRIYLLHADNAGVLQAYTLAALGIPPAESAAFSIDSPFIHYLQQEPAGWLAQYDIDALPAFSTLPSEEQAVLSGWQHELYMALRTGELLTGILALGPKQSGEPYKDSDIAWLSELCGSAALLLAQAQQLAKLRTTTSEFRTDNGLLRRQNQQLSALQRLHHRFVNMITPELRRPLVQITNRVRLAEAAQAQAAPASSDVPETATAQTAETTISWEMWEEELTALRLPVESLVAIASRLQKQQSFTFAPVRINDVLYQVERDLANMAGARRVTIMDNVPTYLPEVEADEIRLVEAFRSLVHNAIKFNKIGGSVQISGDVRASEMVIQVADTGVGIPQDRLPAIWEAYQGQDNNRFRSTTPSLGLLFARFIVEAHGGRIEVSSEYGEGSTFSVCLPLSSDE